MNDFEFFGIQPKFLIDEVELKRIYAQRLKEHHPDFFVSDPEKYQSAMLFTSECNEGYKRLSSLRSRAKILLSLSGHDLNENLPPSFLMEMMDLNETISDLQPNSEDTDALHNEIEVLETGLDKELNELCGKADASIEKEKALYESIQENLLKHKYILRLKETMANIAALN